ncbi:Type 1 glutamine amidotransferase-like domain-containing protein [Facklamia sp. P13055]|uniref:Type 1 glutamine amidotransferase-like domain-containing protein n=1 Tax=Facklamia sp. P13055 TaxID=3421952 RepID=UPI003D172D50
MSKIDRENIIEKIEACEMIYFSGGNSFYLLQELKRLNLITIIQENVQKGMIYIGESVGAIITTNNIEYSQKMDDKEKAKTLSDYEGLSLIDFYIVPHFKEIPFIESADAIINDYSEKLNIVTLNNSEAIIVLGDRVEKK